MRDEVYNRALFRRGAKLRQGTEVRGPSGILASSPELMHAAMPRRFQDGGLVPGIMSNPLQMMAMGAAQAMMPRGQRVPETTGGLMGAEGFDVGAVDITQMPVAPRPTAQNRGIEEIQAAIGDNPEAQQRFGNVISTARDPESTPEDLQDAITSAVGAPNTEEGLKETYEYVAGEPAPEGATVDELNKAIMGAALGGAIGGPGSLAERISKAVIGGLTLQREQALAREAAAAVPGVDMMSALYSDSVKELDTKFFGKVPQYIPTLQGSLGGATPIIAGDQDRIVTLYNNAMDESDRLLGLSAEAESLLETDDIAGFEGSASRFLSRAASAIPDPIASAIGIDKENLQVSGAQRFDVIQRTLAAQLAPMLLGESGRTISDGDRRRVAELLGVVTDDKDGLGLNITGLTAGAFRSEAELREAIREVQGILQRNRQEVESEFTTLAARIPGLRIERPEAPAATPAAPAASPAASPAIVLTEEDLKIYGG